MYSLKLLYNAIECIIFNVIYLEMSGDVKAVDVVIS